MTAGSSEPTLSLACLAAAQKGLAWLGLCFNLIRTRSDDRSDEANESHGAAPGWRAPRSSSGPPAPRPPAAPGSPAASAPGTSRRPGPKAVPQAPERPGPFVRQADPQIWATHADSNPILRFRGAGKERKTETMYP